MNFLGILLLNVRRHEGRFSLRWAVGCTLFVWFIHFPNLEHSCGYFLIRFFAVWGVSLPFAVSALRRGDTGSMLAFQWPAFFFAHPRCFGLDDPVGKRLDLAGVEHLSFSHGRNEPRGSSSLPAQNLLDQNRCSESFAMRKRPLLPWRVASSVPGALVLLGIFGFVGHMMASRTWEFRAKARAGQPVVQAVEQFRKQTGGYPASLRDLVPNYLPAVPDLPDKSNNKSGGWEYRIVTNGVAVSYTLRYSMGRGGVEYEPPNWFGNNEGDRTIILKND